MKTSPANKGSSRQLDAREIKTILVPTDFSEASDNAFFYAANLALSLQAKLIAMHVYYVPPVTDGVAPEEFMQKLHTEKIEAAENQFQNYKYDLMRTLGDQVSFEYLIEPGYAPDQILSKSKNHTADLIIMGTLGQESMAEKILGSVTTRVIEYANCPVMAVPQGIQYEPVRHILFASNLEETDTVILDQLLSYGETFGANISCLHVHTPDEKDMTLDIENLENLYRTEVDSKKLSFQMVNNTDIVRGIHHFVVTHHVDIVTFLTHRRDYAKDNWQNGLTKSFSLETDVPLLAFHEDE